MSTTSDPFSAAQAMAAFNQMNASNPFGTQGQQLLSQGLTKEQANQQSAQAFSAAVQAANPHLDFSKRDFNNMTAMVDPYQQAEDYYRRYGRGMPQTSGGSVGVDPVTGQIRFDNHVGAPIASQRVGDGGLSTEKPSVFPGTESKEVNNAASQLAAMSRPQTITGSPFGGTNTRQSLYQQPMQQAPMQQAPMQQAPMQQAPMQQAPMQQPFAPVNFNSVLPQTFSPPAFSTEPSSSGRTGSPQMQSAFNAGGNSGAIPLEGKIGIVKLAAGGEPKDYLTLSQREEAKPQDALGRAFTSGGLNAYLAALNASSPAPSTPAPSTPAPSTPAPSTPAPSTPAPAPVVPPGYFEQEAQRQRDQAVTQEWARGNAASQQAISTGTPLNYTPAPVDLDALSVQQPASLAATSTPAPTWSTSQIADAGTFIAKNLNDPAKIEAARKEIEQATGRDISVSDILAASKAANLSVSGALADIWSGDKYGPITTQDYYKWINQGVMERPEFSGQEAQAAMKQFGISNQDITRARALDPRFSAGAQFALTTPTYEESGKTGFAALNQKLRDYIQQNAGAIKPEQARERLTQMLAAGTLTGGQALNEYDVQRATGKTLDELFKEATKPKPFVPPPPIDIPAAPSRPVTPIDVPGIDTAFRESPVRTFNPATGTLQYTNPTKLAPATGSGTSWVPPVITSRQRQLLNVGFRDDITTPTYDAVSNMLYQPAASSSQRFAADRSAQMRALQQLRTSVPMGSSTFLQLQSRLRGGEFGGVGGRPVDAAALEAAAKGYAPPTSKVATIGDKYFEKYPDVATAYANLDAATKATFPSPSDYAQYHYDTYGRAEGREMPTLFAHGGPVVKKQSGGDVSRGTSEVPQLDAEGRLIDENAEMRSESQRMLNRLKTAQQENYHRGKLPPGVQRAVTDVMSEDKPPLVRGKAIQTAGDIVGGLVSATPREPTNPSEAYRLAQGFTGAYLPTAPVVKTGQAAGMAMSQPRATMSAARQSLEALGDIPTALAQPNQLGAQAGIARVPGGFFPTSRVPGKPLSDLDKGFEGVLKKIQDGPDDEKKQALMALFNQKAKDFYTKQASSIDDPLRQDILSGRIRFEEGTPMADLFPNQLQKGAAKGDLQSLRMLEQNYDRMIGLKATIPYRQGLDPTPRSIETQIMQHIKNNLDQIPDAQLLAYAGRKPPPGPVGVAQAAAKVRQSLKDNPGLFETYLEPKIAKTLFPRYRELSDVYMVKYPALSPNVVNELRSPGSVKPDPIDATTDLKGYFLPEVEQAIEKNQPIYDIDSIFSPSLLGMNPDALLKEARKLSQRELEKISFPQFVKKAFASSQEADERKKLLEQVPKLIKEGKAPPEKIMLFGTKTFLPTSEGFKWIKVTDPDAVVAIAKGMDNSVASYATSTTYGSLGKGRAALERGEAEIYSLYDKNNVPHMTVEYLTNKAVLPQNTPSENVKNTIAQFTGNGPLTRNEDPGKQYIPHIKALVDRLNPSDVPFTISQLLKDNN